MGSFQVFLHIWNSILVQIAGRIEQGRQLGRMQSQLEEFLFAHPLNDGVPIRI